MPLSTWQDRVGTSCRLTNYLGLMTFAVVAMVALTGCGEGYQGYDNYSQSYRSYPATPRYAYAPAYGYNNQPQYYQGQPQYYRGAPQYDHNSPQYDRNPPSHVYVRPPDSGAASRQSRDQPQAHRDAAPTPEAGDASDSHNDKRDADSRN